MLANATKQSKHKDAAIAAFSAFSSDFANYGIHAAPFGLALGEWLNEKLK
jgi:predicted benzoate:H+ symporter BenE